MGLETITTASALHDRREKDHGLIKLMLNGFEIGRCGQFLGYAEIIVKDNPNHHPPQ